MHSSIKPGSTPTGTLIRLPFIGQADGLTHALGEDEAPERDGGWERESETVQDAISAALSGDHALCGLRCSQVVTSCAGRPLAMRAALEIERALRFETIERHLFGCDKRRRLHRELAALARFLRQSA